MVYAKLNTAIAQAIAARESSEESEKIILFDRERLNVFNRWWLSIDRVNFFMILIIMLLGLMLVITASPAVAQRIGLDQFHFIKKHTIFAFMGLVILLAASFLDPPRLRLLSTIGFVISIALLIAVLIFGVEVKGSKRWLSLFGFSLQPSEFTKTFFVIVNAMLLERISSVRHSQQLVISCSLCLITTIFIFIQPDIGMTLTIVALWMSQLFLSGINLILIFSIAAIVVLSLIFTYVSFPHVSNRLDSFIANTFGSQRSYQVDKSLEAFSNGGAFGVGPGEGVVKGYIPDAHTDFIFAVAGEELGFIFCLIIIAVFAFIITRTLTKTADEKDLFKYLAICGLTIQFALQTIINIGVALSLLPTKGMTLPFISYGGSSTIAMSLCFGIILALTRKNYHNKITTDSLLEEQIN